MEPEPTTSVKTAKNGLFYLTGSDGKKIVVSPEMVKVLQALASEPEGISSSAFYSVLWDYPHFSERKRPHPNWRHLSNYKPYSRSHRASLARLLYRLVATGLVANNGCGWCTLTEAGRNALKSVSVCEHCGVSLTDQKEKEVGKRLCHYEINANRPIVNNVDTVSSLIIRLT